MNALEDQELAEVLAEDTAEQLLNSTYDKLRYYSQNGFPELYAIPIIKTTNHTIRNLQRGIYNYKHASDKTHQLIDKIFHLLTYIAEAHESIEPLRTQNHERQIVNSLIQAQNVEARERLQIFLDTARVALDFCRVALNYADFISTLATEQLQKPTDPILIELINSSGALLDWDFMAPPQFIRKYRGAMININRNFYEIQNKCSRLQQLFDISTSTEKNNEEIPIPDA